MSEIKNRGEISRREFLRIIRNMSIATLITAGTEAIYRYFSSKKDEEKDRVILGVEVDRPPKVSFTPYEAEIIRRELAPLNLTVPEVSSIKEEENRPKNLEEIAAELTYNYSRRINEIDPNLLRINHGFAFDWSTVPEVLEARNITNLEERVLKMISIISVCTKEEYEFRNKRRKYSKILDTLYEKLWILHDNTEDLSKKIIKMDGSFDAETEREIQVKRELWNKIKVLERSYNLVESLSYVYGNPSWNSELSYCNLYATLLMDALNLGHRVGHRVDSIKTGNIVRNGGVELNAEGMHNWFNSHGERHGWVRVSDFSYGEKVKLLEEGYIFYVTSTYHNCIISGITVNGKVRPFLTQATINTTLDLFADFSDESVSGNFYSDTPYNLQLADSSKLLGYEYNLWAIHIDESRNSPILQ